MSSTSTECIHSTYIHTHRIFIKLNAFIDITLKINICVFMFKCKYVCVCMCLCVCAYK